MPKISSNTLKPQASSERRRTQARHAVAVRYKSANEPELRRDLTALRIEEHVAYLVAGAPPLTPEQRERIAALLTGGGLDG